MELHGESLWEVTKGGSAMLRPRQEAENLWISYHSFVHTVS
jgi:hypothetical protein